MSAPIGLYRAASLAGNGTTTPFKMIPRDTETGGLLRLFCTWAAVGTFDGATVALQVFLAGTWIQVGSTLTAAGAVNLSNANAPYGPKYRFEISGGGGSESISIEVATYAELGAAE